MTRRRAFSSSKIFPIAVLLFVFLPPQATTQPFIVTAVSAPVRSLSVSDIDFLNATTPKWLFTVDIRTLDGRTVDSVKMIISLDVSLSTGEAWSDVLTIETKDSGIRIPGSRTITNFDLNRSVPVNPARFNAEVRRRLEETALPSGVIPSGSYRFRVKLEKPAGTSVGETNFVLDLSNPSPPALIAPIDGDNNVNEFPFFQWQYDGPRAQISIFEVLPRQSSMEETASGVPFLTESVRGTSFQYPIGGGTRALKPGKSYVWSVTGLVGNAGGTEAQQRSQLRSFTISAQGTNTISYSALLEELERALPQRYAPLFQQIRAEGMTPTEVMRLNGAPLSLGELLRILNQLRANPDGISFVGLE